MLIDRLRAELSTGLRPDISAKTLAHVVTALEAGEILLTAIECEVPINRGGQFDLQLDKWKAALNPKTE